MKNSWFSQRWRGIWLIAALTLLVWGASFAFTLMRGPSSASLPTLAASPNTDSSSLSNTNAQPTPVALAEVDAPPTSESVAVIAVTEETVPPFEPSAIVSLPVATEVIATSAAATAETTVRLIGEPIIQLPPSKPVPNTAVLRFQAGTSAAEQQAYLTSIGATVQQNLEGLNTVTVTLPDGSSAETLPDSQVLSAAEPDYYVSAQYDFPSRDPLSVDQWALDAVHVNVAWDRLPTASTPVIVAVIDSGICPAHPDLVGRVITGYDFVQDDADPSDTFGHGCSVSGLIAANVGNDIGMAGMAPNVSLLPLRVLDGQGLGTYSDVAAAILYAVDHDARVLNLSLGGTQPSPILQDAIVYAQQKGVIVVAAAGNAGRSSSLYPGAYDGVYSVGSVDANGQRSSFSNYGPTVRLYAPGRDLLTTKLDGEYHLVTGTSFAAPLVSAAAALHSSVGGSLPLDGSLLDLTSLSSFAPLTPTATDAPASATPSDDSDTVVLTGWLNVTYKDPDPASGVEPDVFVLLYTDEGETIELQNVPGDGINHAREYVSVRGTLQASAQSSEQTGADQTLTVSEVVTIGAQAQAVTGSKPYVNILCRFSDSTGTTPNPTSHYQNLTMTGTSSLDYYWRSMSYNMMDLTGSQTYGWFNLPRPRSYYVTSNSTNLNEIARDCTAAADATVNFQPFFGINIFVNQVLDCCAYGTTGQPVTVDGQPTKNYPLTWLPVGEGSTQHIIAHEMGHAFGLPHSSGPANNPFSNMDIYISHWDVMSRSGGTRAVCPAGYGCLGPGTNSYYHDMLGWIGSRQVTIATGSSGSATIDRLDTPGTGINPLMVRIPINNSATRFYTVEVRDQFNADQNIPDHTVIIYDIDLNRTIPNAGLALIVDNDTNRNVNDEGAMWRVGETFLDAANNISVTVTGASGSGFTVQVNNNTATPPAAPSSLATTASTAFSVSLGWQDNSSNETGFRIFRRTGTVGGFTEVATVSANVRTFMDVSPTCATTYNYYVVSYNSSGQSSQSNTVSATTSTCPSSNDTPQAAYTIGAALPYVFTQTNIQNATTSVNEPSSTCASGAGQAYLYSVWYKWTPSINQQVEISTVNAATNYDTLLSLYQGTPTTLTQVGCNDDSSIHGTNRSFLSASVNAGTTYYLMVAQWSTLPVSQGTILTVNLSLRTERFRPTTAAQLVESIVQANGSIQHDLIELVAGSTYTLTSAYEGSENALPPITSNLSIFANSFTHATITRGTTAPVMRFLNVSPGVSLYLSWVKLTKGRLTNPNSSGGAIYNAGYVDLWNVEFLDNEAYWGGAVSTWSSLTGNRVTFARNKAVNNGGGMDMAAGTAALYDSVFLGNQGGWGGGFINWATSTLVRVRFSDNRATNSGGALSNLGTLTYQSGTVNSGAAPFAAGFSNQGKATLSNIRFVYNVSTYGAAINMFDSEGSGPAPSAQSLDVDESLIQASTPLGSPGAVQGQAAGQVQLTLNAVMIENNSGTYAPALRNSHGTVTLNGTTIRNHNTYQGAINNWSGTLNFNGGRVENNTSVLSGGALYNGSGTVNMSNYTLWMSNKSQVGSGGAIANYGTVSINTAVFQSNNAGAHGGAILNAPGAYLGGAAGMFLSNSAYYQGGAIYNAGTTDMLEGDMMDNSASEGGGAVANFNGTLDLSFVTFGRNSTDGYGGAVWHHATTNGSYTILEASDFFENRAYWGGAFYGAAEEWNGSRPTTSLSLETNRFHYNTALESAGAIGLEYTTASVSNSCITANTTGGMTSLVNIGPQITANDNWWGHPNGPNSLFSDTYSGAVDATTYISIAPTTPYPCGVSNDHYTTAYTIDSVPSSYVEETSQADRMTSEPMVPNTCVGSPANVWNVVWWTYRTSETGYTIDFDTLASDYDTVLAVFRAETNGSLTAVACNDDVGGGPTQSKVRVSIQPNQTYYVMVGSWGVGGGSAILDVRFIPPTNDLIGTPLTIVSRPYSSVINIGGATESVSDPVPSCVSQIYHTVWYRYTPTTSGIQVFTTEGTDLDTVIGVYLGSLEGDCNDNAGNGLTSRVEANLVGGVTYYILVGTTTPEGGTLRFGAPLPLGIPTLIAPSAASTTLSRPTFTWSSVAGAARYDIQIDVNNPPISAPIRVTPTSFTPSIPLLPRIYHWRVRAVDAQGYGSAWSPVKTLIVASPAGQAPSRNYSQIATPTLSWSRISGATAYEVQVDTINTFTTPDYQIVITAPGTLEVTTLPLPNNVYFWRVRARQANGVWGAWSLVDSFTVDIP